MPHAVRVLGLLAAAQQGGGWWLKAAIHTGATLGEPGSRDVSKWAQFRAWAEDWVPSGEDWAAWAVWPEFSTASERAWSWDSGLCMALDTAVSFVGWVLFGNSWPGVKNGCQRMFRIVALLLLCMGAHYLWALCWPVLSLLSVLVMGLVWLVRGTVRKLGTLIYWAQRAAGGVPEASDAEFIGPGTGRIPETADLRTFKKVGSAEKWILIKREGHVAVFKAGSESQTIRSPGLYVPVEADSMRGDREIVDSCKGHDKVHLCRHLVCHEEGQHFKEYGLAKDFNGERLVFIFGMPSSVPKEFGSESETEAPRSCGAHRVAWSDKDGDSRLAMAPCTSPGTTGCELLFEDRFDERGSVDLCPRHALDYERRRRVQKCCQGQCIHVGFAEEGGDGVRRCRQHSAQQSRRPSSRRRSPARAPPALCDQDDPEEPELPPRGRGEPPDARDLKRLLAEVKTETIGEAAKRVRERSPGFTPRSSIHKNLAKLGLLGSPSREHPIPLLEEFFNQYAEGRELGLSEEEVRSALAAERGMSLKEITQALVSQAVAEQEKGQKGLTKFVKAWQRPSTRQSSPSASSWEVVETSPEKAGPAATERPSSAVPLRIGNPGIYGVDDRKAGAATPAQGPFEDIAKAIQSQTAEIASLVKSHTENTAVPIKALNRTSEELVFLLRACNQYQLTVGAGEQGQALANALLSAQVGASTKLRKAGFKQKVTNRLAVGLAGPYWGTQEKHALNASADQRPAPPTKLEDWEGRVRRQNDVWSLVYGEEWKPVRAHALERLLEWHQLKETLRLLKKEAGRETMSLADIKFYALLPSATGTAWLELPRTFDLRFPEGWFATEVLPRIERKQERMLWRLTWEGTQGPKPSAHAGGDGRPDSTQKPTLRNLWGPKLSTEEVNKAKERAPLDKDGLLLCWGALTHMGCQNASCGRSHNDLQGKFEALDPCVQMQLLRRGGLRRMKPETKESAAEKIKLLRAGVIKDRVAKIDRKSGQGDSGEQAETRAGGDKAVQFSEVPEEFRAVDYTAAEAEIQEAIKGPDDAWLRRPPTALGCVEEAAGSSAPQEACDMVAKAQALAEGDPGRHGYTYGIGEMATEANRILEAQWGSRAGSSGGIHVTDIVWEPGMPGRAVATIEGASWTVWDYREEVCMSEELAGMLQQPEEGVEKRQCVTKAIAAGIVWRTLARRPSPAEVEAKALEVRVEQTRQALEAQSVMGEAAHKVAPIEAEIRVYTHDTIRANHDKDFRSLAVFPVQDLEDCKLIVIRADYKGDVVVETMTGPARQWLDVVDVDMVFLDRWQPYDTPALGFLFFWHSRRATSVMISLRRESNLAAAAIVGCIRAGAQPNMDKVVVRGHALCFQQVFAGMGVMTAGWAEAGISVLSPVELWSDPEARQGYRPDCDLTKSEVQKQLLYKAADGQANVWWIAPPCTSFCDWGAQNNGTRTFTCPWGGANDCPHKDIELEGNMLSKVAAELFLAVLRNGPSWSPRMWDLPWWREILATPDVQFVEFPMCAFGLGPPDGSGFYHHRTRVVFRRCEALAKALSRCCPVLERLTGMFPLAAHVLVLPGRG
ncbi:unnamed protein product, partial [Symbiodinium microadriaticum]